MAISLASGIMLLVHNLDIATIQKDLAEFDSRSFTPDKDSYVIPPTCFSKKNCVEIINEPSYGIGYATSLQISPNGHLLLTRRNERWDKEGNVIYDNILIACRQLRF